MKLQGDGGVRIFKAEARGRAVSFTAIPALVNAH